MQHMQEKVVKWFESRGISKDTLTKMKVTEGASYMPQAGKEMQTIQFNYYYQGELINTKYRDGKKNFKLTKGAEKIFYNQDALHLHDSIIIVEGEMDALSFIQAGIDNVVSVPNGATVRNVNLDYLDSVIDLFLGLDKVILALDSDDAGMALRDEFIRRLGPEVCYLADFGESKDANEFLLRNSVSDLVDVIDGASQCPLDHVITANDIKDDVVDFIKNGFKPGYQIGLPNFDKIFSTYTGQFITVTGVPSSGKSDFVDMMCVGYQQKYGWKTAYASPENQPTFQHVTKLMRKYLNKMPQPCEVGTPEWDEALAWANNNFYFIDKDRYYLEDVLEKGVELVKRKGIKVLVIDPFNKVSLPNKSSMSIPDYTMEYLSKIDEFCRKYDVLTIVVAHPNKQYKNPDGSIPEPTMYDIKGGGEWYDASYHGLLVHRDYVNKTVKAKVLKVKFQNLGENQAEANFTWEPRSGNYIPLPGDNADITDLMRDNTKDGISDKKPDEAFGELPW